MLREKLMPSSINAVKEKGRPKEFHIVGTDTMGIFTYSSDGLPTHYDYPLSGNLSHYWV